MMAVQIEKTLFERFDSSRNAYLLLDMHTYPLQEILGSLAPERMAHLTHPDFEAWPGKAPLLVQLENRNDCLLEASIELAIVQVTTLDCTVRQVGGWLFSDLPLPTLAGHLSSRLTIRHSQGKSRWRLHDSRVIAHLPTLLKSEQMYQLLRDMQAWYYLDEGAQLQMIGQPILAKPPTIRPISMFVTQPQLQSLVRIETVNSVFRLLKSMGTDHSCSSIKELHKQVLHAQEQGLLEQTDQIIYAAHSVRVHSKFDRHPLITQAIRNVRENEASFSREMSRFNHSALAAIADDLNRNDGVFLQGLDINE